ncbi:hypothetical protein ACHAW5_008350 [Stephanodiscus triporus]|uniref:Strictosidine synthase conserved region domain-containing protein n=1 Tax=Stephanodiscus triporus TaxID=2934178 RepID=A0ABD3NQ85_9STRA
MPLLPRTLLPVVAVAFAALAVRLRLSLLGLSPVSFVLPELPSFASDDRLVGVVVEKLGEDDLVYPECLVVSPDGRTMFASLGDGRIVRIRDPDSNVPTWETILRTGSPGDDDDDAMLRCGSGGPTDDHPDYGPREEICGRPLGMWLDGNDVLLIADAYRGLLEVANVYGPGPAVVRVLATRAASDPPDYSFMLLNSVVRVPGGDVYLTETSTRFRRRRIFHAAMDGAADGRLLRYRDGVVDVVAGVIYMANGLAVTHDGKALLIVSGVRILRYDLATRAMDPEPFISSMPGTGDNVKAMEVLPNGERARCYWAALGGTYRRPFSLIKFLSNKPMLRSLLLAIIPYRKVVDLIPKWTALAVYDEEGGLIETLVDDGGAASREEDGTARGVTAPWISEMEPVGNYLYLASWYNPFLARIDKRDIKFERKSIVT